MLRYLNIGAFSYKLFTVSNVSNRTKGYRYLTLTFTNSKSNKTKGRPLAYK